MESKKYKAPSILWLVHCKADDVVTLDDLKIFRSSVNSFTGYLGRSNIEYKIFDHDKTVQFDNKSISDFNNDDVKFGIIVETEVFSVEFMYAPCFQLYKYDVIYDPESEVQLSFDLTSKAMQPPVGIKDIFGYAIYLYDQKDSIETINDGIEKDSFDYNDFSSEVDSSHYSNILSSPLDSFDENNDEKKYKQLTSEEEVDHYNGKYDPKHAINNHEKAKLRSTIVNGIDKTKICCLCRDKQRALSAYLYTRIYLGNINMNYKCGYETFGLIEDGSDVVDTEISDLSDFPSVLVTDKLSIVFISPATVDVFLNKFNKDIYSDGKYNCNLLFEEPFQYTNDIRQPGNNKLPISASSFICTKACSGYSFMESDKYTLIEAIKWVAGINQPTYSTIKVELGIDDEFDVNEFCRALDRFIRKYRKLGFIKYSKYKAEHNNPDESIIQG